MRNLYVRTSEAQSKLYYITRGITEQVLILKGRSGVGGGVAYLWNFAICFVVQYIAFVLYTRDLQKQRGSMQVDKRSYKLLQGEYGTRHTSCVCNMLTVPIFYSFQSGGCSNRVSERVSVSYKCMYKSFPCFVNVTFTRHLVRIIIFKGTLHKSYFEFSSVISDSCAIRFEWNL